MANRNLMVVGGVLVAATFLLPTLAVSFAFTSGDVASTFATLFLWFFLSPLLFIAGIVLLVVGATRPSQQQQQVVVVTSSAPQPPGGRPCAACKTRLTATARFCTACGAGVA